MQLLFQILIQYFIICQGGIGLAHQAPSLWKFGIIVLKEQLRMKIKNSKLLDFISKHRSLMANFDANISMEQKYKALKNTINILNTHAIKQGEVGSIRTGAAQEAAQQTEEMYIRQLNKMCEGQEQFEFSKKEEKARAKRKTYLKQSDRKKQHHSFHEVKKKGLLLEKAQHEKAEAKVNLLMVPDFGEILLGCSVGFAGSCTGAIINRKVRKAQQILENLQQGFKESQSSTFQNQKKDKNERLKQQIVALKQRARNLYELEFDGCQAEPLLEGQDKNAKQGRNECMSSGGLWTVNQRTTKKEWENGENKWQLSRQSDENYTVPKQMLAKHQKFRPYSVGFKVRWQQKPSIRKVHYQRI